MNPALTFGSELQPTNLSHPSPPSRLRRRRLKSSSSERTGDVSTRPSRQPVPSPFIMHEEGETARREFRGIRNLRHSSHSRNGSRAKTSHHKEEANPHESPGTDEEESTARFAEEGQRKRSEGRSTSESLMLHHSKRQLGGTHGGTNCPARRHPAVRSVRTTHALTSIEPWEHT